MKHTPGPWKFSNPCGDLRCKEHLELHEKRYRVGEGDSILYHGADWPVNSANARLIATAPELLAACIELHAEVGKIGFPLGLKPNSLVEAMGNAMGAIAKAEGGKP